MNSYDHLFKFLIIGDSNVGKTCVLYRLCDETFTSSFISTIGIDFKVKKFEVDGKVIKLQIWDTAGQERFRTITTAYYRGAMGVIIVFDLTNMKSFESIPSWIKRVHENTSSDAGIVILGNKNDMEKERVVDEKMANEIADKYGVGYFEVSAKTGDNIQETFTEFSKIVKERMESKIGYMYDKDRGRNLLANSKIEQVKDTSNCC